MTDKAVIAVARAIRDSAKSGTIGQAEAAITAYEAAKEAAIEKAGDAFERGGWQEGMTPYELIPNDEGDIDGAEFAADCVYS